MKITSLIFPINYKDNLTKQLEIFKKKKIPSKQMSMQGVDHLQPHQEGDESR
uniref:Uncharacterized protein n=1 Tax=Rhizophora mucronata TaxID=61149 RepID=A0A2P2QTS4_RHIMU